jgi:hypothetical protein
MSAWILVFAHSFFAATGRSGEYRIEGVPPGRYTLVVWADGRERTRREVEVPQAAEELRQNFEVDTR